MRRSHATAGVLRADRMHAAPLWPYCDTAGGMGMEDLSRALRALRPVCYAHSCCRGAMHRWAADEGRIRLGV